MAIRANYVSLHILSDRPTVETGPETYPSIDISDGVEARFTLSHTGDAEQRRAFAASLREAADFIERWTEVDGMEPIDPNGPYGYDPTLGAQLP